MATLSNDLVANSGKSGISKYYCEVCDYKCCKKYNWDKHLTTSKHFKATESNNPATEKWQKVANKMFCCENCGKEYNDRTGLWRHKKKCNQEKEQDETQTKQEETKNEIKFDKELFMMIINQNKEILEIVKNGTHNITL